jgi:hypothetical protein
MADRDRGVISSGRPRSIGSAIRRGGRALGAALALLLAGGAGAADRGADGRFEKRTSSHFVLYQDVDIDESGGFRGSRRFEQQLLAELERAYENLGELLGLRPSRPIEVVVYDPGVFDASFAGRFRFAAAGFYHGVIRIRGDVQLSAGLSRVLHHELVHAALHQEAPNLAWPGWFNEGVAEWFEARAVGKRGLSPGEAAALAQARDAGRLVPLATLWAPGFGRLDPRAAQLAYLQSYGMVAWIAGHFGERALRDLCADAARTRDVERSLRRAIRMGSAELEASFLGRR